MKKIMIGGALAVAFVLTPATSLFAQHHYVDRHHPTSYDLHHGTYVQRHYVTTYMNHGAYVDRHVRTYRDVHHGNYLMPHYTPRHTVRARHGSLGVSIHTRRFSFSYRRRH